MTQETVAERAGLKYKHYQAVESGRKPKVQLETIIKIAHACGIEPWQLLHFDEPVEAFAEAQKTYDADKDGVTPKKAASTPAKRNTPKRG